MFRRIRVKLCHNLIVLFIIFGRLKIIAVYVVMMYVLPCRTLLALPCVGSHKRTLLKISSLILLDCPVIRAPRSLIMSDTELKTIVHWSVDPSNWNLKANLSMLVLEPCTFQSSFDLRVHDEPPYNNAEQTFDWKRFLCMFSGSLDFHIGDNCRGTLAFRNRDFTI